jgi:hypothetical protein
MMAPKWENFKTGIYNTFQELRKEVHCQISQEIKRQYPANPKVENAQWGGQQLNSSKEEVQKNLSS